MIIDPVGKAFDIGEHLPPVLAIPVAMVLIPLLWVFYCLFVPIKKWESVGRK